MILLSGRVHIVVSRGSRSEGSFATFHTRPLSLIVLPSFFHGPFHSSHGLGGHLLHANSSDISSPGSSLFSVTSSSSKLLNSSPGSSPAFHIKSVVHSIIFYFRLSALLLESRFLFSFFFLPQSVLTPQQLPSIMPPSRMFRI